MSFSGTAGLVCLVLIAPLSRAADWNGSYSADGRCFCSGTLAPSLASRIVPTPRGGQSVAKVCARIGDGPGMSVVDGRFDRVVYADAQCGHGPFSAVASPVDDACSGTLVPGTDDCQVKGPRWDLVAAYLSSDMQAVDAVADSVSSAGVIAAPAVVPLMGAAVSTTSVVPVEAKDQIRIVEIDGRRWRQAPEGTRETGAPGSRIILDDRVYLDADRTPESVFTSVTRKVPRVAVVKKRRPRSAPVTGPVAPRRESAEAIRERQKTLLVEARKRLASKKSTEPAVAAANPADVEALAAAKLAKADRAAAERLAAEQSAAAEAAVAERQAAEKLAKEQADDAAAEQLANEKSARKTAEKRAKVESAKAAEKRAKVESAKATEKLAKEKSARAAAEKLAKEQAAEARRNAVDRTVETIADGDGGEAVAPLIPALRMPPKARASSREFGYVDAMPISYDYGGGGISVEGSAALRDSFRFVARLGAASDYQELLLGGSYYITPPRADRMTLVMTAGIETGRFELEGQGVSTELDDTGVYLGAASRFVVNQRFELQAGIGFSSFFEGDPIVFGGGFYHVAPKLDVVSRFEVGDNDSLGIGVRYYY